MVLERLANDSGVRTRRVGVALVTDDVIQSFQSQVSTDASLQQPSAPHTAHAIWMQQRDMVAHILASPTLLLILVLNTNTSET
jgi:hypothetical protein